MLLELISWWYCLKQVVQDFPSGPVVKTPRFHCRGNGLDPWLGKFHTPQSAAKKKKKWC